MLNDRIILQKGATTFHSNIDEGFTALVFDTTYHTLEPLTIRIHSLEEAVEAGITTELLCGIPYYHIRQFYEWTDDERPLTVALLPCSDEEGNPDFSKLIQLQQDNKLGIFQTGIWTEQEGVLTAIARVAEDADMNIIVNGNRFLMTDDVPQCDNLSVVFGQDDRDEVISMQQSTEKNTPVGMIGKVMAMLSCAPAEDSIAWVQRYDLNKNEDISEVVTGLIDDAHSISDEEKVALDKHRFLYPLTYESLPSRRILSDEYTLGTGEFNTISRCRVMRKVKRIVRNTLLPFIARDWSTLNGQLSPAAATEIENAVNEALLQLLVSTRDKTLQAQAVTVTVNRQHDILATDRIQMKVTIEPINKLTQLRIECLF